MGCGSNSPIYHSLSPSSETPFVVREVDFEEVDGVDSAMAKADLALTTSPPSMQYASADESSRKVCMSDPSAFA